jgi:hypothetical protein
MASETVTTMNNSTVILSDNSTNNTNTNNSGTTTTTITTVNGNNTTSTTTSSGNTSTTATVIPSAIQINIKNLTTTPMTLLRPSLRSFPSFGVTLSPRSFTISPTGTGIVIVNSTLVEGSIPLFTAAFVYTQNTGGVSPGCIFTVTCNKVAQVLPSSTSTTLVDTCTSITLASRPVDTGNTQVQCPMIQTSQPTIGNNFTALVEAQIRPGQTTR